MFTRAAVREVDHLAVERYGMPSIVLMENAALNLCRVVMEQIGGRNGDGEKRGGEEDGGVLIVAGPGNNGGDGFALARHLSNAGVGVAVLLATPAGRYKGDAATNLNIIQRMDMDVSEIDRDAPAATIRTAADRLGRPLLIVDALLGTGLDRPVREPILTIIGSINQLRAGNRATVVSVDIPSGLDCDTGEPLGDAVRADVTVSFVGVKAGFAAAGAYVGEVVVAGIGAPASLTRELGGPP